MASISEVIRVSLQQEGAAIAPSNMNAVGIITGNQGVLSSAERYRVYKSAPAVASDFGASSQEAAFANVLFETKPNPISAGGALVIGYWRASDETVAATAATLVSEQSSESVLIPILNGISDGSFAITVDGGSEQEVTGLDFTGVSELSEVASILNAAITGASVSENNGYFTVTSATTGATSLLTYLSTATSGTDISAVLGLNSESGAVLTQGAAQVVLPAETKLEGITAIKAAVNIKGAMFIDQILDADIPGIASFSGANNMLVYEVFDTSYLSKDVSNPVWAVKLAKQSNFRCLLSKSGNRKFAATYMARMHTVLFSGQNTAITMQLKELSVVAEEYSDTEIANAKTVGLDLLTTIKNEQALLTSGANDFCDNVYNFEAFRDEIQTNNYNLLKTTSTKIPQTDPGMDTIEDDTEKTCEKYVRNGVFAPGTWTRSDFFGDRQQFIDAIEQKGYYVLIGDLADQTTAERQSRVSPVIQIAVKNAGAVHEEDIIISINL